MIIVISAAHILLCLFELLHLVLNADVRRAICLLVTKKCVLRLLDLSYNGSGR